MVTAQHEGGTGAPAPAAFIGSYLPRGIIRLSRWAVLLGVMAVQAVVALAVNTVPLFGFAHATAVGLLGIYFSLRRNLVLVTYTIAYLTGAEVMWRQAKSPIFYQFAPYLVIVLAVWAVCLVIGQIGGSGRVALLYVLLLVPSALETISTTGAGSRAIIAFALAGPFALAAGVLLTSQLGITRQMYRDILWVLVISAVGPVTIAFSSIQSYIATAGALTFESQSNFTASGGFGPVQVSSEIGLGVLAAILLILDERDLPTRLLAIVVGIVLAVEMLLTFSRGGLYSVAIAMGITLIAQARNPKMRVRIAVVVALAALLGLTVIVPRLNSFTNGQFNNRFGSTHTGRTTLASDDTQIFLHHPVFGVGPGMTKYQRLGYDICQIRADQCNAEASSHTEFTRLLGEHGIAGIIAIALIILLAYQAISRAGVYRTPAVALMSWSIAQMFYANLRIVAIPVAFALAFLRPSAEPDDPVVVHPDRTMPAPRPPTMEW